MSGSTASKWKRAAPVPDGVLATDVHNTTDRRQGFFPALDGLRAVAFLVVLLHHYVALPWGWAGVNLFFVLSGFLITGILLDTRDGPHRARNFYVRRALRIFPLYYGLFIALLLSAPFMHWQWNSEWACWPLYIGNFLRFASPHSIVPRSALQLAADGQLLSPHLPFGMLNLGHLWSLCVEEQFYLVWPWVVFAVRSRRILLWICLLTVVVDPLARVYTLAHVPQWLVQAEILYRATPFQLDGLLLGGLLALLWRSEHRRALTSLGRCVTFVLGPIALLYIGAIVRASLHLPNTPPGLVPYSYPTWLFTWGTLYANLLSAGLILCALQPGNWIYHVLNLKRLRWLGRISYGLYVFHDAFHLAWLHKAQVVCHRLLPHNIAPSAVPTVAALFAFLSTCLIAWLSFRFFEAPFLRLKDRLAPST